MLATRRSTPDDSPVIDTRAFGGRLKIFQALPLHVELVMESLRENAIAIELQEVTDPAVQIKKDILASSEAWIIYFEGKPAVLWGVYMESLISNEGLVWTITTDVVDFYPFMFIKASKMITAYLLRRYAVVWGVVDARYERSIRWLRWLGFEVLPPYKQNKLMLRRFEMRRA